MIPIKTPMQLKIDNVYAINFLRDMVNKGRITLVYCNTEMQLAGCVYKCLEVWKIWMFEWKKIGVVSLNSWLKGEY